MTDFPRLSPEGDPNGTAPQGTAASASASSARPVLHGPRRGGEGANDRPYDQPRNDCSCRTVIRPHIRRPRVIEVDGGDFGLGSIRVILKLELLQRAGSFKARGAFTNLLMREVPQAGVVAASGGNHGAAVAYAAMKLGLPAKVFVPRISSPAKVERIRSYGADLVVEGDCYADALAASELWAGRAEALVVHAFDQTETLLGQGTIGIELENEAPGIDPLLVPVGGGGLIGGIAAWYAGETKVIGVEPEASPTLSRALEAGRPVDAEAGGIAADALAPHRVGELVFPLAQRYVDRVALISDDAIRQAQAALWTEFRVAAEPGGAAAFAALLAGRYQPSAGERVGVLVSGGNFAAWERDEPYTIALLIKGRSGGASTKHLYRSGTSSTGDHILWLSSGTTPNLRHQASSGGTVTITSSVAIVNDTTWSTLVGTWRPGRLELYVDGWSRASKHGGGDHH
jgi:threonine dehydratase